MNLGMKKSKRKLFLVIQSLAYLQAEELLDDNDENVLVCLWADENSQLHKLVRPQIWDSIYWQEWRGSFPEIIRNREAIKSFSNKLGEFDEIIVSSYYNNLMNVFMNHHKDSNKVLLEDGTATLTLDTANYYSGFRTKAKLIILKMLGFDAAPVTGIDIFTSYESVADNPPKIAKHVLLNRFQKFKQCLSKHISNDIIYFINSNYIGACMIGKTEYIDFLKKSIEKYKDKKITVLLHRYDDPDNYREIDGYHGAEVLKLDECVETYFRKIQINPWLIITSGSGATKSLSDIYGFNVSVMLPPIHLFYEKHRFAMQVLADQLGEMFTVEFL